MNWVITSQILKLIPVTLSCFYNFLPKARKKKMPSVDKSQAKRAGFASTSVLKHEFPSVIHIHALLSKVHFSKHPFSWLTNCDMKTGWRRSGHTVRPLQERWMVLDGRLDGAREVQTKLMKPLCFSKRLIPQSKESEVIQISERWLFLRLWMDHRKGAIKGRTSARLQIELIQTRKMAGRLGDSR